MKIRRLWMFVMAGIVITQISGCGHILNARIGASAGDEGKEEAYPEGAAYEITDTDRRTEPESTDMTEIDLRTIEDGGRDTEKYTYENGCLTIVKGGEYIISGESDHCRLVIRVYDDEIVHLFIKGIELHGEAGPVIYGEQADKIIITLWEGTESRVYDDPEYASENAACIFSNCDLTINGRGSLDIRGFYHDGLRSRDRLKIVDAEVAVMAKNNGIRGNDGVMIRDSDVEIQCEGTGIRTDSETGDVMVEGGCCRITAGENAVYADRHVLIRNCVSDLYSLREIVKCKGIREIDGESKE